MNHNNIPQDEIESKYRSIDEIKSEHHYIDEFESKHRSIDEINIKFRLMDDEIKFLNLNNADLVKRLQKYTNSDGHKKYYEKNKEKVKINGSKYLKKLKEENPEKLKEYAHRAYMNRKYKLLKKKNEDTILIESRA